MRIFRHYIKYIIVFLSTVILLTGLLVSVAMIPKPLIRKNLLESAEFLCEEELFRTMVRGVEGSRIDRYADSILLAIAWKYDREHPMESVMWSSYYYTEYQNENVNLLDALTKDMKPNQQYLRYWHGSNVIVRPLLLFFNIQQIYTLNGLLMILLIVWLLGIFLQRKDYVPVFAIGAGLVLTSSWFVPLSLEYIWTYFIMLVVSIIGVKLAYRKKWNCMGMLFMLSGMVTGFMDFLTTETLTLLVPLLLVLWIERHVNREQSIVCIVSKAGKAVIAWAMGYVCMWGMKWIMASIVCQINVMPYVTGHIQERIGGDIGIQPWKYVIGAVFRNVKCIFPLEYGVVGILAAIVLLFLASYVGYVYHRKYVNKGCILLYLGIGMMPYVRYMVLHNHSYLHAFFTYRAQMTGIVALVLILEELTVWKWHMLLRLKGLKSCSEEKT